MKKLFTKICLLAVAMVMGGASSAWAEAGDVTTNVNIDFSNAITDGVVEGTKGSMTIGTGSGADARVEGGWLRQGDVTNVVTIPEEERAGSRDVVNVQFKMAWGNKNGMGSKFELLDENKEAIVSFSFCRWGSNANNMDINMSGLYGSAYNNAPILDRHTIFDITIDYAAKKVTSKVSCTNPKASQTFVTSLTNTNPVASFVTGGFNVGGNTDRADAFDDLIITTTEGDYTVTTADYIVKYVDGSSSELKSASAARTGDVGSAPSLYASDKDAIYVDGKKYVYASDNASSLTIADDNSTVVTVVFSEVAKYSYTIKAVDGSSNEIKTLASGETFTDEPVNMYIPLQIFKEGKVYGISGENSWRSYTITSSNQTETITYPNVIDNVVAFIEGESATGAAESTPTGNLQLASCGHMGRGTNLPIGTISEPGKYQVTFHYINTNASAHTVTISVNGNALPALSASARNNYSTEEFLAVNSDNITFTAPASSTSGVDYIYIVKTGDYSVTKTLGTTGFGTFAAACNVTVPEGVTVYTSTFADETITATADETIKVIPANTGVIFKAEAGTEVTFVATAEEGSAVTTALTAAPNGVAGDGSTIFGLLKNKNEFAMVMTGVTLAANSAYLEISLGDGGAEDAKAVKFVIDGDGATAANAVSEAKAEVAVKKFFKNGQLLIQTAKGMVNAAGAQVK